MKLYIYKVVDGKDNQGWDSAIQNGDIETVEIIDGETNEECETKAAAKGYDDTDIYGWSYNEI